MTTESVTRIEDEHDIIITNPHILNSLKKVDAIMAVFVEPTLPEEDRRLIRDMLVLSIDDILEQFEKTKSLNFSKIATFSSIRLCNSRFKSDHVADIIVRILSGETVPIQFPSELANPVSTTLIQSKISILLSQLNDKNKDKLHPLHKEMLGKIAELALNNDVLLLIQEVLENQVLDNLAIINKIIEIINNNSLVR
jgi:hypothetical protein